MWIKAWMQMGTERRETEFDIPFEEVQAAWARCQDEGHFESWIEEVANEWVESRFGWGWSGGGFNNDFSFMENSGGYQAVIMNSAVPNTIRRSGSDP